MYILQKKMRFIGPGASNFPLTYNDIGKSIIFISPNETEITMPSPIGSKGFNFDIYNEGTGTPTCDGIPIPPKTHAHINNLNDEWVISVSANPNHTHSDYLTSSEINILLLDKADTNHDHDDKYYREEEIDTKLTQIITKEAIEAVLTGNIESHEHDKYFSYDYTTIEETFGTIPIFNRTGDWVVDEIHIPPEGGRYLFSAYLFTIGQKQVTFTIPFQNEATFSFFYKDTGYSYERDHRYLEIYIDDVKIITTQNSIDYGEQFYSDVFQPGEHIFRFVFINTSSDYGASYSVIRNLKYTETVPNIKDNIVIFGNGNTIKDSGVSLNTLPTGEVTKEAVESVLTGEISTHEHDLMYYTEAEIDTIIANLPVPVTAIYEPLVNGDINNPELMFDDNGDIIMVEV